MIKNLRIMKKLLERFENSPRVKTIKFEMNENGSLIPVVKLYNSIADAHRDNPKISCSHIEDYCNSSYFSKKPHYFRYDGYFMAFTTNDVLSGKICSDRIISENYDMYLLHRLHYDFWNDMADKLITENIKFKAKYNWNNTADEEIIKIISKLEYREVPAFMYCLYIKGWNKEYYEREIINWLDKNVKLSDYLMPNDKMSWSQNYKQANYF